MRSWFVFLVLLLAGAGFARAEVPPREPIVPRPPPATSKPISGSPRGKTPISGQVYIGERAPDFVLDGSFGRPEKLSSLRGRWVLLVFAERYRTVASLDSIEPAARQMSAQVVTVCHEKQQTLMTSGSRDHVGMLMLADPTGEVAATYGLFDWRQSETQAGFFVLDPDGVARLAVLGKIFPPGDMADMLRYAKGDWDTPQRSP